MTAAATPDPQRAGARRAKVVSARRLPDSTRVFDAAAAGAGLLVLAPFLAVVAILVWWRSGRPVLYVAERVGQHGRSFALYKFRTMVSTVPGSGPAVTIKGDPRVTPIGRILRRTKIDELPQLVNVLSGDMSLVGPRPEDPKYVARYTPAQRQLLDLKPGVTSLASLCFRREEELLEGDDWERRYVREIVPAKARMEIAYADRRSVPSDIRVILTTLARLIPHT